ncbi:DsbE family thiol:disulfide interchange protein [Phaeovulum sp.]|uniref:DsbE family thiol:disulfide interchange protein n=1 Tax=Phaeovulum sp. TaxID=2934796 RepID=UPI0039E53080
MAKVSLMMLPPLVFAGLAGMFLWGMTRDDPRQLPSALAGKEAPAVQMTPLGDGAPFTDVNLRDGQVKLVNFWASWCAPCRVEHPNLSALAHQGVQIYGVNYKDTDAKALRFLAELGDPYTAKGADRSGRMGLEWGVYGVPETFVVDGDGKILFRFAGPVTQRVIDKDLRPLLGEITSVEP